MLVLVLAVVLVLVVLVLEGLAATQIGLRR
jgi:hypothetical protein